MHGPCAFKLSNTAQTKYTKFYGIFKGKSTLMVYDRYPNCNVSGIKHSGRVDIM